MHASERDTPEVGEMRRESREEIDPIGPRLLVLVDETGVTTAMTPACGRTARGERVEASWVSMTVIAAMGLDGVRAPLAFPGRSTRRTSSLMWSGSSSRRCGAGMSWFSTT